MKQNLKEKQKANVKTTEKQNKGESVEFVSFFREHLKVPFCICAILSIAIILVSVIGMVKNMDITEASFKFSELFMAGIKFVALDIIAGVVPFFYMPFLSMLAYMHFETQDLAFCIIQNGWFLGALRALIPLILGIICISYTTALGIYICKISTAKYRLGRSTNMNWTNFRLRVYQVLKNEEKYNALAQKQEKHQEKLKQKNQKYNWKMLGINILIILAIFTISIILKKLFIY
jgi:hypothetical protein